MAKKYSLKFWIIFWLIAAVFLVAWFFFWQFKNRGIESVSKVMDFLPIALEQKEELKSMAIFAEYLLENDNQTKTFLILFQNNMEIRPGGGYIGSFGILKIKDGKVLDIQVHDLSNFDGRVPNGIPVPYPMWETLRVKDWKLRDSNWSPDFPTNAKKAEEFYYLGKGEEKFDGVVGITANVLTSFLKATGPVKIEGYPGEYGDENAIITLEYQVEKGFYAQDIERGERKSIMKPLAMAIIEKASTLGGAQKIELAKIILEDLNRKDIQLYFHDERLQKEAEKNNWAGKIDSEWKKDFLAISDANLGAYKSDYYVKRSVDYSIDLTKEKPEAILKITYQHTAKQKDWMTKDYVDFLRVYLPEDFWLINKDTYPNIVFSKELGRKYLGVLLGVPLDSTRTFEFKYTLPSDFKNNYDLKVQKQPGINDVPVAIHITQNDGTKNNYEFKLNSDTIISELR